MGKKSAVVLLVGLILAAAGVARWARPQLGDGTLLSPGTGFTWANDGVENTRMLVRGRPAPEIDARFTVRNNGNAPLTLTGFDGSHLPGYLEFQRVTFQPGPAGIAPERPAEDSIRLSPGAEAIINWSLDLACRPVMSVGSHIDLDTLPLRIKILGVTRTHEFPLPYPITLAADPIADPGPTAACDD